jgi:hypothetical protein
VGRAMQSAVNSVDGACSMPMAPVMPADEGGNDCIYLLQPPSEEHLRGTAVGQHGTLPSIILRHADGGCQQQHGNGKGARCHSLPDAQRLGQQRKVACKGLLEESDRTLW